MLLAVSPKLLTRSSAWPGAGSGSLDSAIRHSRRLSRLTRKSLIDIQHALTIAARRPTATFHRLLPSVVGGGCQRVFVVGDPLAPVDRRVLGIDLVEGEVDHQAVGGSAVPVLLPGLEQDPVTGADDLDRAAPALAEPDALGDEDRLAERVRVPRGPCARGEVHEAGLSPCGRARRGDRVDVDVAREPLRGAFSRIDAAFRDLHGDMPCR